MLIADSLSRPIPEKHFRHAYHTREGRVFDTQASQKIIFLVKGFNKMGNHTWTIFIFQSTLIICYSTL